MRKRHLDGFSELFSKGPIIVFTCEAFGDFTATFVTPNITEQLGYEPAEFLSISDFWTSNIHPDDGPVVFETLGDLFENGHHSHQYRFRHKDGTYRWLHDDLRLIVDDNGQPETIVGYWTDISDQKKVEHAHRESEARFRDFTESASDWFWEQDTEFKFTTLSAFKDGGLIGGVMDAIGHTRWDFSGVDPDQDPHWQAHRDDLLAHRSFRNFRYSRADIDGQEHTFNVSGKPVFDELGSFSGYRGTVTDITEKTRLETTHKFQANIIDAMMSGLILVRLDDSEIVYANPTFEKMFAYGPGEIIGKPTDILNAGTGAQKHETARRITDAIDRTGKWRGEVQNVKKDGSVFWCFVSVSIMDHPEFGTTYVSINSDITERKALEEQLRQSQKMEGVGHLAGGVAHDFNNLLGVMIGNAEMLEVQFSEDQNALHNVNAIIDAVDRAAALTQRLLAFSRQQTLAPRPTAINDLVRGLEELLHRTLGEAIELETYLGPKSCNALVDPNQFENALINLSINARDAMAGRGTLTIAVSNVVLDDVYARQHEDVTPGDYVVVAVSDTGSGMSPEVLENVFEPFFTTKDIGEGSGLGLSMVYGFVKQSDGHISIVSRVDAGTTIKLYFPKSNEAASAHTTGGAEPHIAPGSERILVVEDDDSLRGIPIRALQEQGYEIVEARDGKEAIMQMEDAPKIDLLFTDIVLPGGMTGADVAVHAKRLQPEIKILFTTGYSQNSAVYRDRLGPEAPIIIKPYRRAKLLEKIRQILDTEAR